MKDGVREFIPVELEQDLNKLPQYQTPEDVRTALLAANPHIQPDRITIDATSGRGIISIIDLSGDLKVNMPQGLEMRDGKLIMPNDPTGKIFEMNIVSAHNDNLYNPQVTDGKAVSTESLKQAPYQSEVEESKRLESAPITSADIVHMGFKDMKNAWLNYTKSSAGELKQKQADGTYTSADENVVVNDSNIKKSYEFASMWKQAYENACNTSNSGDMAFSNEYEVQYKACMQVLSGCVGKSLDVVALALFELCGSENSAIANTVIHFAALPEISALFEINCNGITPEEAIIQAKQKKDEKISSGLESLVGKVKENMHNALNPNLEHEEENEDDLVLEKKPPNYT